MPWKNGGGTTYEVDREPLVENYDWRLSQARIQHSGPFSEFPGYARLLAICAGDGILFQQKNLIPGDIVQFDGATAWDCQLLGGEVWDLGLIYNPIKVKAALQYFQQSTEWTSDSDVNYFFNFQGVWHLDAHQIAEGSCLKTTHIEKSTWLYGTGSLFVISIQKVNPIL